MASLPEKIQKWTVEELNIVSECGFSQVPEVECFTGLSQGKYKKVWNYVINHVRSKSAVQRVKHYLSLKKYQEDLHATGAILEPGLCIDKLKINVLEADEKRQFLKAKLSAVEENILLIQGNIDQITKEKNFILQKTALLELLRVLYKQKTDKVKNLDSELKEHKDNLQAYHSSNKFSVQSDFTFGYSFLFKQKIIDGVSHQIDELYNVAHSVIKLKLSSEIVDKALLARFQCNYRGLRSEGFLLTDLLFYLSNQCNSYYLNLTKQMKDSVSISDFRDQSKDTECIKRLLCQLKYESVQNALFPLKNRSKVENLQSALAKQRKEIRGLETNSSIDADLDMKYALVNMLAENEALIAVNSSLEKQVDNFNKQGDLLAKECEEVHEDLSSLIRKFQHIADVTFFLSQTSAAAYAKVLNTIKDLQLFVQNETFQSLSLAEFTEGLGDQLSTDRKLMFEMCEKKNLNSFETSDPYGIQYPLSPEVRRVLPVELHENFASVCRNCLDLKDELRLGALNCSEVLVPENQSMSTIDEKIRGAIKKLTNFIGEGEVSLSEGMVCCETNRGLVEDWWGQKAQYIPDIVYEGKTLKMWIDILHALNDFDQVCLK